MSYWGSKPTENDYAFDAVGVYVLEIRERMFKDMATVLEKRYPEQSIVASLQCLRLLAEEFPRCVRVSFGKKHFAQCKEGFLEWYKIVQHKLPEDHRKAILAEAEAEFALFEEQILIRSR